MRTLLFILLSLVTSLAQSETLLIRNATIVDGEADAAVTADVFVRDGKIVGLGQGIEADEGVTTIDAAGKPLTPGFFNADTRLGLTEINAIPGTNDTAASNEMVTASLRVADAINPNSTLFAFNRSLGLTHSLVQPSHGLGLFAGQAAVVQLNNNAVIEQGAAMVVSLGEHGSELVGGSRAAAMALLREALEDARDYARNKSAYNAGSRRDYALSRHDLEALVPVVQKRMPLLVNVERAADIQNVIRFAKDQGVTLILSGVAEGWMVAKQIAAAKVPVIIDPIRNLPESYETLGARLDNAQLLHEAGVELMFTGMGWQNTHNAHLVRQSAGNAVANGLPYKVAIKALTTTPARIFGVTNLGAIKVGAQASLVLWSGDPLEVTSEPELVMINGKSYSLQSRAVQLRDRYYKMIQEEGSSSDR